MSRVRACQLRIAGLLLSSLWLAPTPCAAQLFFEDSEGQDLFLAYGPGYSNASTFDINSKDKSARLRAFFQRSIPRQEFHALELRAKAPGDLADVFTNAGVSPGVTGAYLLGKMRVFTTRPTLTTVAGRFVDWAFVRAGYTVEKFDLFDADTAFADQIRTERFRGLSVTANYTLLVAGTHLFGVTAGYERRHNAGDLKEVTVRDDQPVTGGAASRTVTSQRTVRQGEYAEMDTYPLRVAWTRKPGESPADSSALKWGPAVYLAARATPVKDPTTLGLAGYLTKANKAGVRTTIGGVYLEARDLFDATDTGRPLQNRFVGGVFVNLPVFLQR